MRAGRKGLFPRDGNGVQITTSIFGDSMFISPDLILCQPHGGKSFQMV